MFWDVPNKLVNRGKAFWQRPGRLLLSNRRDLTSYRIGKWSYGPLEVVKGSVSADLVIGNFCSFAAGTTIFLGGEHDTRHVTTFPLSYFFDGVDRFAHSITKGNVNIGNDVWVGAGDRKSTR